MFVLNNTNRADSGVYQCVSIDTDTFEEISGETTVFINCKNSAPIRFIVTFTTNAYYQQHQTAATTFVTSLSAAAVDLDAAVILEDNITVAQGEELKATCNALSSLPTHTTWFKVTYTHTVQYSYTGSNSVSLSI